MRRVLISSYVVLLAAVACGERVPTAARVPAGHSLSAFRASPAIDDRLAVTGAVEDARNRIVPGLGTDEQTADLAAALDQLLDGLTAGGSLNPDIQHAEHAVDVLVEGHQNDAGRLADLAAVKLAIEQADHLGD